MKKKIGIGLIMLTNIAFLYLIIMMGILSFGLITAPLDIERGSEVLREVTSKDLYYLSIFSILNFLVTYIILLKLVENKYSIKISLIVTIIGIILFIPFFLSSRFSFINYIEGNTTLNKYIDEKNINEVRINNKQITDIDNFINDIGNAKYKKGVWKYAKKWKIILYYKNGTKDSLYSNGELFGAYKDKYFFMDENIIAKYINEK